MGEDLEFFPQAAPCEGLFRGLPSRTGRSQRGGENLSGGPRPPKATERGGFPTPGGPKKTTLSPLCSLLRLQEGDFPRKGGRCVHITGLLLEISWIAGPPRKHSPTLSFSIARRQTPWDKSGVESAGPAGPPSGASRDLPSMLSGVGVDTPFLSSAFCRSFFRFPL